MASMAHHLGSPKHRFELVLFCSSLKPTDHEASSAEKLSSAASIRSFTKYSGQVGNFFLLFYILSRSASNYLFALLLFFYFLAFFFKNYFQHICRFDFFLSFLLNYFLVFVKVLLCVYIKYIQITVKRYTT
jgi:hypothetical protein